MWDFLPFGVDLEIYIFVFLRVERAWGKNSQKKKAGKKWYSKEWKIGSYWKVTAQIQNNANGDRRRD